MDYCKWRFEKYIFQFYKNSRLKIYPLKLTLSEKLLFPEEKLRLNQALRKSNSSENVGVPKVTLEGANDKNCSSENLTTFMDICNCYCKIVKSTPSP